MRATVAESFKIVRVFLVGTGVDGLVTASIALSVAARGSSFCRASGGVGEATAVGNLAFLAVIAWPLAIALDAASADKFPKNDGTGR